MRSAAGEKKQQENKPAGSQGAGSVRPIFSGLVQFYAFSFKQSERKVESKCHQVSNRGTDYLGQRERSRVKMDPPVMHVGLPTDTSDMSYLAG